MIWAGLSCMSYLMMGLMMPAFERYYSTHPGLLPDEFYTMMEQLFEVPRTYFVGCGLLYAIELLGAVYMWNLRRSGFHCYTLARLLLVLLPLLFLGRGAVALGDIMFALLFIFVYYLLLRQLGVFGSNGDNSPDNQSSTTSDERDIDGVDSTL